MTEFKKDLSDINKACEEVMNLGNSYIDVSVFKEHYLPFLLKGDKHSIANDWITHAGSPFAPMDIIKDGKLLITTPGLFGSVDLGDTRIDKEILGYELRKDRLPGEKEQFAMGALNRINKNLSVTDDWDRVFKLFNDDEYGITNDTEFDEFEF